MPASPCQDVLGSLALWAQRFKTLTLCPRHWLLVLSVLHWERDWGQALVPALRLPITVQSTLPRHLQAHL